jgi:hypothetical protein
VSCSLAKCQDGPQITAIFGTNPSCASLRIEVIPIKSDPKLQGKLSTHTLTGDLRRSAPVFNGPLEKGFSITVGQWNITWLWVKIRYPKIMDG